MPFAPMLFTAAGLIALLTLAASLRGYAKGLALLAGRLRGCRDHLELRLVWRGPSPAVRRISPPARLLPPAGWRAAA